MEAKIINKTKLKTKLMELESYTGEIKMFAGQVLPNNWEWCDGKTLAAARSTDVAKASRARRLRPVIV